jgi:dCMP deaminase
MDSQDKGEAVSFSEDELRGWMRIAYRKAAMSPDRSTQNGAVIISLLPSGITGHTPVECNRFTDGVNPDDDAMHEKPLKYEIIVHAERAAVYAAARGGCETDGSTMVCCWAPCAACAQAIVEAGIETLVVHQDRTDATPERWKADVERGMWILKKGNVRVHRLRGPVNAGVSILFNGESINV